MIASCLCSDNTTWYNCHYLDACISIWAYLTNESFPVLILHIFMHWVQYVPLEAIGWYIHKRLVYQYPFLIGNIFYIVGVVDPLMESMGNINFSVETTITAPKLITCTHLHPPHPPRLSYLPPRFVLLHNIHPMCNRQPRYPLVILPATYWKIFTGGDLHMIYSLSDIWYHLIHFPCPLPTGTIIPNQI